MNNVITKKKYNLTLLLNSLFTETRDIAASPLKASQAYKNIVDDLQSAKIIAQAANEIVEEVHKKVKMIMRIP